LGSGSAFWSGKLLEKALLDLCLPSCLFIGLFGDWIQCSLPFWLDTTALPGAGGGGVDDLVLAVLLRFGVAFSPSVLVRLAALLVVFSEDCMLSSATALRFREIAMCMKCVEAVIKGKMR
jgi:hypothetical protein